MISEEAFNFINDQLNLLGHIESQKLRFDQAKIQALDEVDNVYGEENTSVDWLRNEIETAAIDDERGFF